MTDMLYESDEENRQPEEDPEPKGGTGKAEVRESANSMLIIESREPAYLSHLPGGNVHPSSQSVLYTTRCFSP